MTDDHNAAEHQAIDVREVFSWLGGLANDLLVHVLAQDIVNEPPNGLSEPCRQNIWSPKSPEVCMI